MQRFLRYALAGFALVAPLVATASLGAQANASGSVTQQFNCKASFDAYAVSDGFRSLVEDDVELPSRNTS